MHRVHIWDMNTLDTWMKANERDDASVARALGNVSRSQVNRLRNGKSRPSWQTAVALEALTGLPAAKFMEPAAPAEQGRAAA